MGGGNQEQIIVRLPADIKAAVDAAAEAEGVSRNRWATDALRWKLRSDGAADLDKRLKLVETAVKRLAVPRSEKYVCGIGGGERAEK